MVLPGSDGQFVRLTDERLGHIISEHPEMAGLEWTIGETLLTPDVILVSRNDPARVREYYKNIPDLGIGNRFIKVVVGIGENDAFVITAHIARRLPSRG